MTHASQPQQTYRYRVALLGIFHESNTFIHSPTTLQEFLKGHLIYGQDIKREYGDAFHEIAGMLEFCEKNGIEVIPVMYAAATPGGKVGREDYEMIRNRMLDGLLRLMPLDGCLVVPHGAAVAEGYDDMDGDWLSRVRAIAGDIPIVGTLDPHANVSEKMTAVTDTLIAYSTNPHVDQRATGERAAQRLFDILRSGKRPSQVLVHTGLAISIEQQMTNEFPCRVIYKMARELERQAGIDTISIVLGFPYADVPEMGTSVIITGADRALAQQTADILVERIREMRNHFVGVKTGIAEAVKLSEKKAGPVLLLDMGDNVGGGAPGDSAILLTHIENNTRSRCLVCLHDPALVEFLRKVNDGDEVFVKIGGQYPQFGLETFEAVVRKIYSGDGKFSEDRPRHGGQAHYDMGWIAMIETARGSTVLLMSNRIPPFSLRQVTAFGIDPGRYDIIVAKGVNAPIAAYRDVCSDFIQVDTPGFTQADMTRFTYHKRKVPLFPFE